jgi:hypothetical protein
MGEGHRNLLNDDFRHREKSFDPEMEASRACGAGVVDGLRSAFSVQSEVALGVATVSSPLIWRAGWQTRPDSPKRAGLHSMEFGNRRLEFGGLRRTALQPWADEDRREGDNLPTSSSLRWESRLSRPGDAAFETRSGGRQRSMDLCGRLRGPTGENRQTSSGGGPRGGDEECR